MFHESNYPAEFILSEAPGKRSRSIGKIAISQTLKAGTVLAAVLVGSITIGAAVAQVAPANAGNGVFGGVTTDDNSVMLGDWKIVFVATVTDLGNFQVVRPDGTVEGTGKVGTAYNGALNFTIADGSSDFKAGDLFTVTISQGAALKEYKAFNADGADGTQVPAGISYADVTTGASATVQAVVFDCDGEVNGGLLDYGTADAAKIAKAVAGLASLGIKVRT